MCFIKESISGTATVQEDSGSLSRKFYPWLYDLYSDISPGRGKMLINASSPINAHSVHYSVNVITFARSPPDAVSA